MGRRTLRDADWEPYSRRLLLRVTPAQIHELDVLAVEFGVTRAWLLRRAVGRGLPPLVAELRDAYDRGLRVVACRSRAVDTARGPGAGASLGLLLEPDPVPVSARRRRRPDPVEWD